MARGRIVRLTGLVRFFDRDRGFGFLQLEDPLAEIYVGARATARSGFEPRRGERVLVSVVERHDGRVIGTDSLTGHFDFKTGTARIYVAVAWKAER